MSQINFKELVILLEKELIRLHYKDKTLQLYRKIWSKLTSFFESKGEEYFTLEIAMVYLDERYDFFAKQEKGELNSISKTYYHSIQMLSEYQLYGSVSNHRRLKKKPMQEKIHNEILSSFHAYCISSGYARYTWDGYGRSAKKLLFFAESRTVTIKEVNHKVLEDFVKTLLGYSPKMVEFTLCGIRSFLRFLFLENILKTDFSGNLPKIKVPQKAHVPSIWESDILQKMFAAIDRGNPAGKRDYAIFLLASLLGMRSVDIRKLQFSDINWNERRIDIIQSKTRQTVSFPLLSDVGWAIIDYVKNGRPECEHKNIFVRHVAPIRPFACAASFDDMIKKYMKMAHVSVPKNSKYGMHSLRHTYATSLMEKHVPIEDIAQLMGHVNTDTTTIYLKSSLGLLSECPLNIADL